jgi:hypothetical protein
MTKDEMIKEAIKRLAGNGQEFTFLAEVTEVDEPTATISVDLGDGLIIDEVRLRSTIDGDKGFYIVPKVGSMVMLLRLATDDEFICIGFSGVEKVVSKMENTEMEINDDTIVFNANALNSFMTDINKLVQKLNALENGFNSLVSKYNSHTHLVSTTGTAAAQSGTAAATTSTETTNLQQTTKDDLKDAKILN